MVVHAKSVPPPAPSPRTGVPAAPAPRARRRNDAGHATVRSRPPALPHSAAPSPAARRAPPPDRGTRVLLVFVAATLIMVAAVALVGAVGQWWVLVPVMLVDFILTFIVLALVVQLLGNGDGGSA